MFENLIRLNLESEYAVGKRNCVDPFVILEDGAKLIFDELLKIPKELFSFEEFCFLFAQKYDVEIDIIREDVKIVLEALKDNGNMEEYGAGQIYTDNTYQYAYDYYNSHNQIFKVFFELTYTCNLMCRHCYLSSDINSFKTKITLNKAKKIIDELYSMGVVDLTFTGGECFNHPEAYEIIKYACSYNFIISILTNGSLLNQELISKITLLPISSIRISLYGMKTFHDKFVGVDGAFDNSLNALKLINQFRNGLGSATSVITKDNVGDLLELNRHLKRLGIEHKLTPLIYPTVKGDLGPAKLRINKAEVTELINKGVIDIIASNCGSGISRLRITPNGDVNPCELFREVSFGNVLEDSMLNIIKSENRKTWIDNIKTELKNNECSKCPKTKYCPKCIGVSFLENGNFTQKTASLCSLAEAKIDSLRV